MTSGDEPTLAMVSGQIKKRTSPGQSYAVKLAVNANGTVNPSANPITESLMYWRWPPCSSTRDAAEGSVIEDTCEVSRSISTADSGGVGADSSGVVGEAASSSTPRLLRRSMVVEYCRLLLLLLRVAAAAVVVVVVVKC